jgi:uncharacterized membrane protein YfcA
MCNVLLTRAGITAVGILMLVALSIATCLALPSGYRKKYFWISFLVICLGGCIGALLGALATPFYASEDQAFKLIAGIGSAFLAGFVWKSFHGEIKQALGSLGKAEAANSPGPACLLAFLIAMFLSAFVNYAFREYACDRTKSDSQEQLDAVQKAFDELRKSLN